jgi:hypothetical protein
MEVKENEECILWSGPFKGETVVTPHCIDQLKSHIDIANALTLTVLVLRSHFANQGSPVKLVEISQVILDPLNRFHVDFYGFHKDIHPDEKKHIRKEAISMLITGITYDSTRRSRSLFVEDHLIGALSIEIAMNVTRHDISPGASSSSPIPVESRKRVEREESKVERPRIRPCINKVMQERNIILRGCDLLLGIKSSEDVLSLEEEQEEDSDLITVTNLEDSSSLPLPPPQEDRIEP